MSGTKKLKHDPIAFTKETVKEKRIFPRRNTFLLAICISAQLLFAIVAILYTPEPQDIINDYRITVNAREDSTLDIEYYLKWTPLDESEPLTWVQIGMANNAYSVDNSSLSPSISYYEQYADEEGYVFLDLYLDREYSAGETLELSFTVNQSDMITQFGNEYIYDFIPCWFNTSQVEHYLFRWKNSDFITVCKADRREGDYWIWEGALDYGEYVHMDVTYDPNAFPTASPVHYEPNNDIGAYNELESDQSIVRFLCVLVIALLIIPQVYIIDSYVSYNRGRGFLTGYGQHLHTYGQVNPRYTSARAAYLALNANQGSSGSIGRGGGCACACACACAGGGRAGCSQKDGYKIKLPIDR